MLLVVGVPDARTGAPTADGRLAWGSSDALRSNWTRTEVLEFPGSLDGPWARHVHDPDPRGIGTIPYPLLVPADEDAARELAKRTLTNLYNERPTWLALAHRRLDEAVAAAYGWPAELRDEEILERLLALNLERAPGISPTSVNSAARST